MGLLLTCFFVAGVCSAALCVFVPRLFAKRIARSENKSRANVIAVGTGCLLTLIAWPLLGMSFLHGTWWLSTGKGRCADSRAAASTGLRIQLPAGAADIDYYYDFYNEYVSFTASEEDFLAWTAAKSWKAEAIKEPEWFYGVGSEQDYQGVEIARGYSYKPKRAPNHGGFSVFFDADRRRTYYQWNHH